METSSLKAYPFTLVKSVMMILLFALLLMVLCAAGLFEYQSRQTGMQMSQQLLGAQGEVVEHKLENYLNTPRQLSSLMRQYLLGAEVNFDSERIRPELVNLTSEAFSNTLALQGFSYSTAGGEYFALQRDPLTGHIYLERTASAQDVLHLTRYSGLTEETNIVKAGDAVDVRAQSWFKTAQKQRAPWWTISRDASGLYGDYYLPVYSRQGEFQGVISSHLRTEKIHQYLTHLLPGKEYAIVLVDAKHQSFAQTANAQDAGTVSALLRNAEGNKGISSFQVKDKSWIATGFMVNDSDQQLKLHGYLLVPTDTVLAAIHQQRTLTTFMGVAVIALLMLLISFVILRFTGSLKETEEKVKDIGQQPWNNEYSRRQFPELMSLNNELEKVSLTLPSAFSDQRSSLEEDDETGLLTLGGLLNKTSLYENRNLMAMIKVSNFNSVKNALGSKLAKEFIQYFVERLRSILPEGALCCRDREDTLIIAFAGMFESKDVAWYRSVLSSVFRLNPKELDGESHFFTGHAGMVIGPISQDTISECLRNVSLAVQHAQTQPNGTCELYTPQMREEEVHNLRLHRALRDDLQNEVFHLVMQPIVSFVEGAPCVEGECLIRWQSQVLGFVPPDKFIALAEHTGMIVPLGKWIIDTACRELAAFIQRGAPEDFKLHINISAVQLQQSDFARHLLECIHRYELKNSNICIEITESVLLQDTVSIVDILAYLRRLGISVAIDDFGSGYSSLSYLHSLPFDCLKIDRGFVRNVLDDKKSEAVISSVLMLSQSFEVPLVAEGVETAEMAAKLHEMGCDLAQGYYYARPKPFAEFTPADGMFVVDIE